MSQKAELILYPNRYVVTGPSALVVMTEAILTDRVSSEAERRQQLTNLLWEWHVICSISGEEIRIPNLKYWDVEKQTVYARPEVIPIPEPYRSGRD